MKECPKEKTPLKKKNFKEIPKAYLFVLNFSKCSTGLLPTSMYACGMYMLNHIHKDSFQPVRLLYDHYEIAVSFRSVFSQIAAFCSQVLLRNSIFTSLRALLSKK